MKKITTIIIVLLCINGLAQDNKFYYSGGEKHYLITDSSSVIILTKTMDKYESTVLKIKLSFNKPNDKILYTDQEDNAIMIESSNLESMSINNIMTYIGLDNNDIELCTYGKLNSNGDRIWVTNEVILKLHPSGALTSIDKIIKKFNGIFIEEDQWNVITIKCSTENDACQLANALYESGKVKYALPNMYMPFKVTSDPLYNEQFYLHNTGQTIDGTNGQNDIDIDAHEAWDITKGSSSIKVAVIDDGVEVHEDLKNASGNSRVLDGFTPNCLFKCKGQPKGSNAHGQACAGIIAASHNNVGIKGVAPYVHIIPIRIFKKNGSAFSNRAIARAINKAWDDLDADILSNSWGTSCEMSDDNISEAIENAISNGRNGKGCVVVFSAGNSRLAYINAGLPDCIGFPANQNNVLTVGSIDKFGNIFAYSQRGPELDVVSPSGETNLNGDIRTTDREGNNGYETGDYTNRFGGTSAASPQAAGVAALILSINPNLPEAEVRCRIKNAATDMGNPGRDDTFGFGRLNANVAVSYQELMLDDEILTGEQRLESNNIIAGNVVVENGSNVIFQAKETIHLKPGFHAQAGSNSHAYIDPYFSCDFGQLKKMNKGNNDETTKHLNQSNLTYKTTYSENSNKLGDLNLNVYPNPFQQSIKIEYNLLKVDIVVISIFDLNGNEIFKLKGREQHEVGTYSINLNLSNFRPGTYILTLATGTEKVSKLIVKQ